MKRALRAAIATAAFTCSVDAWAEPVRILVGAGSKVGLAAERPLKFAANDAGRVRDVMVNLGGVRAENAFVLAEPTKAQLFGAIDRARNEALKHPADEVTLVFYFSGHGDRDALHLGDERVPLTDLSQKLSEVPAGLRIAVTDACRATREKGFTAEEPFSIAATMLPDARGQVWLHASSDGEAAQESDELQGAIFTHAWLNGLRGAADSNGDARVTLEESFAFAHAQTLIRSAKSSGVLQKPEAVVSLREGAPLVLTQTVARMAALSLPASRDTHFMVYSSGGKSVLSELWAIPDRRLLLRLPPGRYVVQKRASGTGGAAQIAIAEGEERRLEERDFTPSSLETLARKGGALDEPDADRDHSSSTRGGPNELSVGWDIGHNARSGFVHGPRATYARAWRHFALSVGGGGEFGGRSFADKEESLTSVYGRASAEGRLPMGPVVLRAGAGGRAGYLSQSIEPTTAPRPGAVVVTAQNQGAFAFGPELFVGGRLDVAPVFVDLGATANLLLLREEGSMRGVAGVTGGASLGTRF